MRHADLRWAAVALTLVACKKPPPPAPPEEPPAPAPEIRGLGWEALNPDATLRIQQTATAPDVCEVKCVENKTQAVRWTAKGCRGTALDLRFASPDCSHLLVIHTLPNGSQFRYAVLASSWSQAGIEYEVKGGGMPIDAKKMQPTGTQFRWLRGVLGDAGDKPHFSADGNAVELEALDGSKHTLPFVPVKR